MPRVVEEFEFDASITAHVKRKDFYILKIIIPSEESKKMQHLINKKVHVHIKVIE